MTLSYLLPLSPSPPPLRVFTAVVITALSIGRASSFAPDAQKAQLSASRVMTLLRRQPEIDGYDKDGLKPVSPV